MQVAETFSGPASLISFLISLFGTPWQVDQFDYSSQSQHTWWGSRPVFEAELQNISFSENQSRSRSADCIGWHTTDQDRQHFSGQSFQRITQSRLPFLDLGTGLAPSWKLQKAPSTAGKIQNPFPFTTYPTTLIVSALQSLASGNLKLNIKFTLPSSHSTGNFPLAFYKMHWFITIICLLASVLSLVSDTSGKLMNIFPQDTLLTLQ